MYYGGDEGDDAKMEENSAGTIAIEAVSNIRIIVALALGQEMTYEYAAALAAEEP